MIAADFLRRASARLDGSALHPEALEGRDASNTRYRRQQRQLGLPPNVLVIGTMNIDETTHGFSPKVLDRANVIVFNEVDAQRFLEGQSTMPERTRSFITVVRLAGSSIGLRRRSSVKVNPCSACAARVRAVASRRRAREP